MSTLALILLIVLAFVIFISSIWFLKRKIEDEKPKPKVMVSTKFLEAEKKIDELLKQIKSLQVKIAFYEEKGSQLDKRIRDLRSANLELERQKKLLYDTKERLEKLQTEKDELFTIVVHDIKNPAAAIQNFVKLLDSYDLNAQDQQEVMMNLVSTSTKIIKLAEEVSRVMTVEEGLLKLNFEKHQINDVINFLIRTNEDYAKSKGLELTAELDDSLDNIEVDIDRIEEVIENLIVNAIKFSPNDNGSKITVITRKNDDISCCIAVKDQGPGIHEDEVEFIFDKGSKTSNRPTGGEASTGLGLWIAKRIVSSHKGKIWVESQVGEGSEFIIQLPYNQTN